MNFLKAMLIVSAILPTQSCEMKQRKEPEPVNVVSKRSGVWFDVERSSCTNVTIDGMPCIYCENPVHGGYSPALTCDWSKKNP